MARELDLYGLSQKTTAVSAFQVLTIGSLADANLEVSVRSFMRHINARSNSNMQDFDNEKKRKRLATSHNTITQSPAGQQDLAGSISPPKRVKNDEDGDGYKGQTDRRLPRSIESLYKSIMSAQEEIEVGRAWEANELEEM